MIALTEIYASTWLLLRSSLMIFTSILGIFITDKKQYFHHWFGITLVTVGVAIVCVVTQYHKETQGLEREDNNKIFYGMLVILS